MKWIVLQRVVDSLSRWETIGTATTRDEGDRVQQESEAVRQLAGASGVYAVVPFEEWRLHEAEARIVSHPVPRAPQEIGQVDVETEVTATELGEDEDMAGLVQGPKS